MHTVGGAPHETATAGKSRNLQQQSNSNNMSSVTPSLQLRGKASKTMYTSKDKLPPKPGQNMASNAVDEASENSIKGAGLNDAPGTRGGSIFDD